MASSLLRGARQGIGQLSRVVAAAGVTDGQLSRRGEALRGFASEAAKELPKSGGSGGLLAVLGLAGAGAGLYYAQQNGYFASAPGKGAEIKPDFKPDYGAVRQAIVDVLDDDEYEDGSYGPVLVRLAWHSSGTWDKVSQTGGSNGAGMRFPLEANHGANAGLGVARDRLEPVKRKFPWISYSDLWTLAGATAIEEMGGPTIPWRPGRNDYADESSCPPEGRLPDGDKDAKHLRQIFYKMGFEDRDIVALSGAHALGRTHRDRSGWEGPWTNAPTTFSNLYFKELLDNKWKKKKWDGPEQYEDPTGALMMLPTDMWIIWDKKFKKVAQEYAKDEELFFKDFAAAFSKLLELGVPFVSEGAIPPSAPPVSTVKSATTQTATA